jgi:hypothetical protein
MLTVEIAAATAAMSPEYAADIAASVADAVPEYATDIAVSVAKAAAIEDIRDIIINVACAVPEDAENIFSTIFETNELNLSAENIRYIGGRLNLDYKIVNSFAGDS